MERHQVNPWSWQDRLGFSQGWKVDGARSLVFVAGQGPISDEGELVGEGDFEAQVLGRLREYGRLRAELMPGPAPASTAVEVGALAVPGMMIEVEALAVV